MSELMNSSQCTCDCDGVVSLFTRHMGQYGTAWDSMGPYGPPPSPHPRKLVSNSWHITSSSLLHTRLPETLERHCLMQSVQLLWQSSEHLLQEISISPFLKASLSFLVLVPLPSPKCFSSLKTSEPEWSHHPPWLPECVLTRRPAEPRALGTIIQRFRPLPHFSSDFKSLLRL